MTASGKRLVRSIQCLKGRLLEPHCYVAPRQGSPPHGSAPYSQFLYRCHFGYPQSRNHLCKILKRMWISKRRLGVFLQRSPATLHFLFRTSQIPHLHLPTPSWPSQEGCSAVTNNFLFQFNKGHTEFNMECPKLGRTLRSLGWEPDLHTVHLCAPSPGSPW